VSRAAHLQTEKRYREGTHRTRSPAETMARFAVHARSLGITRIANVTGLDYLGVPVFMAMRPNSKSLSVSQGKGIDAASAKASALMEAIELAHAESVPRPTKRCDYVHLSKRARATNPAFLPRLKSTPLIPQQAFSWMRGVDLMDGAEIWVPYDLVHTDFSSPARENVLFCSSNGLASGNHYLEAVCAGICEVIERDATTLWNFRDHHDKAGRRLRLGRIRERNCRALLDQLDEREMSVAVWNITTDIGVACFLCRLQESPGNQRSNLRAFWGAGCHLSREVAFLRAVTEAAQSRLTYISGSRDDLHRRDYLVAGEASLFSAVQDAWEVTTAQTRFDDVPARAGTTFEADVASLLEGLRNSGIAQVAAVDLTNEQFGIPVVRIIIPGLEAHDSHARLKLGPRARALARASR